MASPIRLPYSSETKITLHSPLSLSLSLRSSSAAKMLEDSASAIPSSMWASMNSWFTPTVLFLLLNLMIGTIAFTSALTTQKHPQNPQKSSHNDPNPTAIARSPSVLQRLKSINFYASPPPQESTLHHKQIPDSDVQAANYFFPHPDAAHESPPHFAPDRDELAAPEIQTHLDFEEKESSFGSFEAAQGGGKAEEIDHARSMDEVYSQLTDSHFSRTKSDTKPASGEIPAKLPTKMRKSASVKSAFSHFEEEDIVEARRPATVKERGSTEADDGVDAKADDFINRFKQQLKLQRLDSIIRYKDMIGRGR